MKNRILSLAIVFILFSCQNRDELGLTDSTKKWVYYDSNKIFDKDSTEFLTFLKFDKDGKCVNYFFNGLQYGSSMDWEFTKSDSILEIGGNKFLILNIYRDSILMKDFKYNKKVKMLNWNILDK